MDHMNPMSNENPPESSHWNDVMMTNYLYFLNQVMNG